MVCIVPENSKNATTKARKIKSTKKKNIKPFVSWYFAPFDLRMVRDVLSICIPVIRVPGFLIAHADRGLAKDKSWYHS